MFPKQARAHRRSSSLPIFPAIVRAAVIVLVLTGPAIKLAAQSKCQPPTVPPNPLNLFSEEQEAALGEAVASHIENSFNVIDDEEVTSYLRRVGQRLIERLPATRFPFQFYVVDINDVNAFTLPGGRIYVTRKLIAFAKNEDELAGVVAHELGHVMARHLANDMSVLMREILGAKEIGDGRDVLEKYHLFLDTRMTKPKAYEKVGSREDRDQYAADMIGLYLMAGAGYDSQAQAAFWDRYHETKGKTGNLFSNLFGTTKPEQKRLREMFRQLALLPAECKGAGHAPSQTEFQKWQATVIRYKGLGRKELLPGLVKRTKLDPPLRSRVYQIRFSPDGKHLLAQDDAGISVLTREPFALLFRINSLEAYPAQFSPDSQQIVFYTPKLRVETWSVADQSLSSATEMVLRDMCLQTRLSPDGKTLACLDDNASVQLLDVAESAQIFEKKSFTTPSVFELLTRIGSIFSARGRIPDEGHFVNMEFSPDARYFVAGDHSFVIGPFGNYSDQDKAIAFSLLDRKPLTMTGDLKRLAIGGFAFVGADRIVGRYYNDDHKSGLYSFPAGIVIERFDVPFSFLKPVARGDYVLLSGARGPLAGALWDLKSKKYFKPGEDPVLDFFETVGAAETARGELALYGLAGETPKILAIPENPLGRIYAVDLSPDLKYLALSGSARGAVWDLEQGKMLVYIRGFRGAKFSDDGLLYMDFPAQDQAGRGIAHFDPAKKAIARGPTVNNSAVQFGDMLVRSRPEIVLKNGKETFDWSNGQNTIEVFDTRTMSVAWSQKFSEEFPSYMPDSLFRTIVLGWSATSRAALTEFKTDPAVSKRLSNAKESEDDYFFKVLDLKTGKRLGGLLVETNQRSFRIVDALSSGDYLVLMDNQNRAQVYSLSRGSLVGRVFGNRATLSQAARLLCVENESGQLTFYDLESMEKRGQLTFADRVKMVRFSADGKRLAVLTANQMVAFFDVAGMTGARSGN